MRIILYKNNSEPYVVNKKFDPISIIDGNLRDSCSIVNPSLIVESDDINITACNYIYIVEWNRYYFVNDITSVRTGLWAFSCHVDVLTTYKNDLLKLSAIVARQENKYNLYLDDDKFLVNAQRIYWTKAFPNRVQPGNGADALSFILTMAGGEQASA